MSIMGKINYKRQLKINNGLKLLDNSFRTDFNSVRLNAGNTLQHELAKCKKCWELIYDGQRVITEAVFKNGGRADIYLPETLQVFEILHSETEQMALKKLETYPEELDIFFLKSEEVLNGYIDR